MADADARWVDNLISRFAIPGVNAAGRGSARRLTADAIAQIALVRSLTEELGLSLPAAVPLAHSILSNPDDRYVSIGPWLRLGLDRAEFVRHVDSLIADGVESLTPLRRGRPTTVLRSSE